MSHDITLVYLKKSQELGVLKAINFIEDTVTVENDSEEFEVHSLQDVQLLHQVAKDKDGITIFNYDYFRNRQDELYELEVIGNGMLQFYRLDKDRNRKMAVDTMAVSTFLEYVNKDFYTYVGNRYIDLAEKAEEERLAAERAFNVQVVRDVDGAYHYACHNKAENKVDLIKVVFLGATILEEQYGRWTLEVDHYFNLLEKGELDVVDAYELREYAETLMRRAYHKSDARVEPEPTPVEPPKDYVDTDDLRCEECDPLSCCKNKAPEPVDAPDLAEMPEVTDPPVAEDEVEMCEGCNKDEDDCECEMY